jgi:ParB family chromosome partitioning protein
MHFERADIEIARIDADDTTYRITAVRSIDALCASISALGLLHAPLLIAGGDGYTIISGFRRLAVLRRLGAVETPARLVPPSADGLTRAKLAIADNAFQRPLNPIENSRALNLLAGHLADERQLSAAASELNLPAHPAQIDKIRRLGRLPLPVQTAVLEGTVSTAMAVELAHWDAPAAVRLVELFTDLGVGLNRQREILSLLVEVARREGLELLRLMADPPLNHILTDADSNRTDRNMRLVDHLRRRRYPRLRAATDRFEQIATAIQAESGIRLTAPKHFEGRTYSACLTFERLSELRRRIAGLEKIAQNRELADFLEKLE